MSATILSAQLFGFFALLLNVVSFQLKHRNSILMTIFISSMLWVIYWFMMGAITASFVCILGAFRARHFAKYRDKNYVFWFYMALIFIISIVTFSGWITILSALGAFLTSIANWQKDEQNIRKITFVKSFPWIAHNIIVHSNIGLLAEALSMSSAIVGFFRYKKKNQPKSNVNLFI